MEPGKRQFWRRKTRLRLECNALLAPNTTGLVHLGCKGNRVLFGKETGMNLILPEIIPREENREGLILLERVDL